MKVFFSLSAIFLLFSAQNSYGAAPISVERRVLCGQQTSTAPLRQLYNPATTNHFYTTNVYDVLSYTGQKGYTSQTNDANVNTPWLHVYPYYAETGVPLYRLWQNRTQTYLYTSDTGLRQQLIAGTAGWADDSGSQGNIAGYVYPDGSCPGTTPLLWASSNELTDNFYTVVQADYNNYLANGYTAKGSVGWVYPNRPYCKSHYYSESNPSQSHSASTWDLTDNYIRRIFT